MSTNKNQTLIGPLQSSPVIHRHPANPLLSPKDVPYGPAMVFNAGVTKYEGQYVMVFRNDYGNAEAETVEPARTTNLGLALSDDGVHWNVQPQPVWSWNDEEIVRVYDPRLTVMDGRCYMCFAVDTKHGVRGGIAVTDDFHNFDVLSMSVPDNRNMVLFPERIGGKYVRLERPFPVYGRGGVDRFDTWLSDSPDLRYWGDSKLVLGVEDVPFANDKVGPGAPPIKTAKGWLTTFHAVDIDQNRGKNGWERAWKKRYSAGIMLLDLEDPSRIVGMSKSPLLAPEAAYETSGGFRNDVIFPGGMILEPSGEVKIYYGAADTVECLATAHVDDLLGLCLQP
ncbi:beta-1,4-mannooligosaccharide/beta-1,4-mannosyl-N-acetylglucosamine phosphorylase [Paenibacillus sp. UNCCL117]|uniref:glycoside hydrolase family 130 protein n=1 Tax=unclassified Paenibacillus TaxID=185978 RepID=UPI0008888A42|nr:MULTISPECIES: glycoside hydrolase family 130 protein [unclassified Paenibacillus]SDC55020.1 beta-1,4-mannooligosaccharide/beta-1,4-mannosyl-N-acetylglucosamine phosphorylase [Paenibacillus sp. cl123]SFW10977.1 beta-1,4-mannooligosaccharide/beta-1,4-mannosyl-N-acetylglucosamine phosphorylase [Paenibacillus sp. UNCCL117]